MSLYLVMKDKSNDMSVCCNQNAQLSCDAEFINPQGKVQQQSKFRLKDWNLLHVLVVYLCFKFGVVGVWRSWSSSYSSTVASTQAWRRKNEIFKSKSKSKVSSLSILHCLWFVSSCFNYWAKVCVFDLVQSEDDKSVRELLK